MKANSELLALQAFPGKDTPSLIQSYFIFNKFFEWKKEQQQTIGHAKILF